MPHGFLQNWFRLFQSVGVFVVALVMEFTPGFTMADTIACYIFVILMLGDSLRQLRSLISDLLQVRENENDAQRLSKLEKKNAE